MTSSLADLPWLLPAPADFRDRCRQAAALPTDRALVLAQLSQHRLDLNQLVKLAQCVHQTRVEGVGLAPLRPFRLGLTSNATMDLMAPAIVASALRYGVALEIVQAPFGLVEQVVLDRDSSFQRARPDAVLLAFDHHALGFSHVASDNQREIDAAIGDAIARIDRLHEGLEAGCGAPMILQTLAAPPERLLGAYDLRLGGTESRLVDAYNRQLVSFLRDRTDFLLDVAALAQTVGIEAWHDPAHWHAAKLPFHPRFAPFYGDHVARLIGAARGMSRKCLVLDLDNTLWGGVVGDDGVDGIVVGQGTPAGEAYLAIQRMALDLRERGIILAVCSKNDDAVAREPFRKRSDMLLREEHFAVFQANWCDKAENLRAIASQLNIGVDALVFVDDNPAERAIIRRELASVAVPELPDDPAFIPRVVLGAGYFEAVSFSSDDRMRSEQYRANAARAQLRESSTDIEGYLRSLEMTIQMSPFDGPGRARIAQLINKSNQYNLTTRRYTEAEVQGLEGDPNVFTLQARLIDRFGDSGMISVVICRPAGDGHKEWHVDSWLMSCRVLGRRVEHAILNVIVSHARKAGIEALVGHYVPSGRNTLVQDHYSRIGFTAAGVEGKTEIWRLPLARFKPFVVPMAVKLFGRLRS